MTPEKYEKLVRPFREHPERIQYLKIINRIFTVILYAFYPVFLIFLLITGQYLSLLKCILVPGISFGLVSIYRDRKNAPRPYENGISALLYKDTKGHSFPSRHVFSCFIIAMTALAIVPAAGIILLILGVALAFVRVIGGVHYPKDVLAGALIAVIIGIIFYFII